MGTFTQTKQYQQSLLIILPNTIFVTETDPNTYYVAEDGITIYWQESSG